MIDHCSYTYNLSSFEIKAWKTNSGLHGIRIYDLCDTGTMLNQLSSQANWELVTLWVRTILVDGEEHKWIYFSTQLKYMIFHIFSFNNIDLKYF